jgi:hypothetical protein
MGNTLDVGGRVLCVDSYDGEPKFIHLSNLLELVGFTKDEILNEPNRVENVVINGFKCQIKFTTGWYAGIVLLDKMKNKYKNNKHFKEVCDSDNLDELIGCQAHGGLTPCVDFECCQPNDISLYHILAEKKQPGTEYDKVIRTFKTRKFVFCELEKATSALKYYLEQNK